MIGAAAAVAPSLDVAAASSCSRNVGHAARDGKQRKRKRRRRRPAPLPFGGVKPDSGLPRPVVPCDTSGQLWREGDNPSSYKVRLGQNGQIPTLHRQGSDEQVASGCEQPQPSQNRVDDDGQEISGKDKCTTSKPQENAATDGGAANAAAITKIRGPSRISRPPLREGFVDPTG